MKSVNKGWWKSPAHSFFLLYICGYSYFPRDQDIEGMQGSSFSAIQGDHKRMRRADDHPCKSEIRPVVFKGE